MFVQTLLPQGWLATCPPYLLTTGQRGGPLVIQHCARRVLCCRYQLSGTKERLRVPHSGPPLFTKVNVGEHRKGSLSLTRNSEVQRWSTCLKWSRMLSKTPTVKKHKPIYNPTCFCTCRTSFSVQNTAEEELSTTNASVFGSSPWQGNHEQRLRFSPRGSWRLQSSGMLRRAACLTLKTKTICSFERSLLNTPIYQSTQRNILKDFEILSK